MGKYKVILFDLDGTLSDPKEGITKSVQYALEKMGIHESNLDQLTSFIGPPLQVSFEEYYGFNKKQTDIAINYYRERFKEKGMFENKLYADIPSLLNSLMEQGYILAVATSKPTVFAEEIIKHFEIDKYFELIVGSHLDGTRTAKAEIIANILDYFKEYGRNEFIMVGDRKYDIIGANANKIHSIGVTYGYGSGQELKDSNPTYIVDSVSKLQELLTQ